MKKLVLLVVLATVIAGGVFAEWYNSYAEGIDEKFVLVNAGIGIGFSSYGMGIPPISASADFKLPISVPITVGAIGTFSTWSWKYWGNDTATITNIGIGARGHYHFNFVKNLDTYAGITLGWIIVTYDDKYSSYSGSAASGLLFGANIGARYFFTDMIGAYLELGYSGLQVASIGLSLKF